jgi:predicted aspartyl protease
MGWAAYSFLKRFASWPFGAAGHGERQDRMIFIDSMGAVRVTIDLENTVDADNAAEGLRLPATIRRHSAPALVDTGAVMLVLPEDVVDHLGLKRRGRRVVSFADDRKVEWDTAGPVTLRVGNRYGIFDCLVGPPTSEPLFGQIQLESLDLIVDATHQTLTVRPESPLLPLLSVK